MTFCLAVGLVAGKYDARDDTFLGAFPRAGPVDWFTAFIAAAETAVVVGLLQEVLLLRRFKASSPPSRDMSTTIAAQGAWRLLLAACLTTSLFLQVLKARGIWKGPAVDYPDNGNLLTTFVGWLGLIVAVSALSGNRPSARSRVHAAMELVGLIAGAAIIIYSVIDHTLVLYLVHIACAGIDAALHHARRRYGLMTHAQEARFAAAAAWGLAAWLCACYLFFNVLRRPSTRPFPRVQAALGAILLLAAASYDGWYYRVGLRMASPDLTEAGLNTNWYSTVGALVIVFAMATVGAFRSVRATASPESWVTIPKPALLPQSPLFVALLLGATATFVIDFIRSCIGLSADFPLEEYLPYMLMDPAMLMKASLAILGIQLAWVAWKSRRTTRVMEFPAMRPRAFLGAWVTLAALLVTGALTIAAFGLSSWLGPWYLE